MDIILEEDAKVAQLFYGSGSDGAGGGGGAGGDGTGMSAEEIAAERAALVASAAAAARSSRGGRFGGPGMRFAPGLMGGPPGASASRFTYSRSDSAGSAGGGTAAAGAGAGGAAAAPTASGAAAAAAGGTPTLARAGKGTGNVFDDIGVAPPELSQVLLPTDDFITIFDVSSRSSNENRSGSGASSGVATVARGVHS